MTRLLAVLQAAVGTIASALADVGYKVEWAGRLQDFQRTFLSEREIAANAFAEGMFLVVHEQLGAAVVASEGSSDGGRGSSRRTRSQRQAPLKVLDGDALGKVE